MTDDDSVARRNDETELAAAKLRLDNAYSEFVESHAYGGNQVASVALHTRVMDLYWRMYTHLRKKSDAWRHLKHYDAVGRDYLWQGKHPQMRESVTIRGLRDLEEWAHKTKSDSTSGGALGPMAANTEQVRVLLPAEAAIAAAKILKTEFNEFGWGASIRHGTEMDEPEPEDLAGLLKRRGQDEAMEQLPERFETATDGGEPDG